MSGKFIDLLLRHPAPLRTVALGLARRLKLGSYQFHLYYNSLERPHYAYIMFEGAQLAKKLGLSRISVIEFGVAGGNGLVNMEYHAGMIEQALGVRIDIYGFDTGEGLPPPQDFRDLPYHWQEGFFRMDQAALRKRLTRSRLVIGNVSRTLEGFLAEYEPAPIAAISHDFDYFSSTAAALKLFDQPHKYFLPRVFCYFDDTVGGNVELYNDYTGQRGAINEYNRAHDMKKLSVPYYLKARRMQEPWYSQVFIHHDFEHPQYNQFISEADQQLKLA